MGSHALYFVAICEIHSAYKDGGTAMSSAAGAALAVGDQAPDLIYRTREGQQRHLAAAWADGPALVVWLRHFG